MSHLQFLYKHCVLNISPTIFCLTSLLGSHNSLSFKYGIALFLPSPSQALTFPEINHPCSGGVVTSFHDIGWLQFCDSLISRLNPDSKSFIFPV